jgi:hypothetical protein
MRYDLLFLFASFGAVYFFAYRFLFHKVLKWKMLHSIWLPLVIEVLLIGYALYVAIFPQPAGSWSDLISIVMLLFYSPPVIVFFILYFIYAKRDQRKA